MSFFKHVGTANGTKKVIIVQRTLGGDEQHMASVIYSEIIPSRFHDDIMKVLESDEGQSANEFRDVLQRRYFTNGENMLTSLHSEGYIKKVATNNVIVRPNSKSAIRLDELNKELENLRNGNAAQKILDSMNTDSLSPAPADPVVTAHTAPEAVAPTSSADDDRLARLEKMMMGLAETVQTLAETKKPRGRPAKTSA